MTICQCDLMVYSIFFLQYELNGVKLYDNKNLFILRLNLWLVLYGTCEGESCVQLHLQRKTAVYK